ncbi:DUF962 domain-containing protein [Tenacibaculum sp. MEBiC06402]|uniref:Mpo1 family 2-hydroxy fatty acid dioxygenase n=1 Tax=unclassified Tenacibaculum TaxID=2635139 RepID=UPI003B9C9A2C
MKTAGELFAEYSKSHQNEKNQLIHYICVPVIFFSIIGLIMTIPNDFLKNTFKLYNPLIENWGFVIGVLISVFFYLRLSFWYFIKMLAVILICIAGNNWISNITNLFIVSLTLFVIAWIGQFYGHKIEGKKPSFLKDLQFLLVGPLWVLEKLTKK